MSHIYIDGTKITANANKGNDRLLHGYNIQQCKQKNHRDSLFRESRLFNMLFLYSNFCGADDGNRTALTPDSVRNPIKRVFSPD